MLYLLVESAFTRALQAMSVFAELEFYKIMKD